MIAEACDDLKRELIDEFRRKRYQCVDLDGYINFNATSIPTITVRVEMYPQYRQR